MIYFNDHFFITASSLITPNYLHGKAVQNESLANYENKSYRLVSIWS
jgi:hypothetical protein